MAAIELDRSVISSDREAQMSGSQRKPGGWITFPFITGCGMGLTIATGGIMSNFIVYLIEELHVKSIDAAQISNIVNGCSFLFPIIGAVIADSVGCFSVISVSSFVSLLGMVVLTLTAAIDPLRPQRCENGSNLCKIPSKLQFAVLYAGIGLITIGIGGTRFTIPTMGADQFNELVDQGIFFNWYFVTMYASSIISATAIVYLEDNVSWAWGYGVCVGANFISILIFLLGKRFYHRVKPQGSPFIALAQVIVAALRKYKVKISSQNEDYYHHHDGSTKTMHGLPTKTLRFLNRAALVSEGDVGSDGLIAKPWRLCTIQQLEDFKALVKILPLWSTSIFLSTPTAIQASMTILQALTMDRHIGPHFKIPTGSILVIVLLSTCISLAVMDHCLCPLWKKIFGRPATPLQRIGVGHVFIIIGMVVSALVESKRLNLLNHSLLAMWLFPQLILVGIGDAFQFPGQVALYYQEFPLSLRNTATAVISIIIGVAYYLSTLIIHLVQRATAWLPNNINNGRLDKVYWMLVVVGVINFSYFLICTRLYTYQSVEQNIDDSYESSLLVIKEENDNVVS